MRPVAEPALPYDEDPRRYAELLGQIHDARLCGGKAVARPRKLVDDSWRRMELRARSITGPDPAIDAQALGEQLDKIAESCGSSSTQLTHLVEQALLPGLADSELVGVLATSASRVAARFGTLRAQRSADRIGFVEAAAWGETQVGTNAIGLATLLDQPVQIHGPEHWCLNQHDWSCAAAPIHDPASGRPLMVIDVSCNIAMAHPALLSFVQALAGQVELQLRDAHREHLERLRARTWGAVSHLRGPWAVTDQWGWVAGAVDLDVGERIRLPEPLAIPAPGLILLPGIGAVEVARVDDALILVPQPHGSVTIGYRLDRAERLLTTTIGDTPSVHRLSVRHAEILTALCRADRALTVAELMERVWGRDGSEVTARVEVSRLRKRFPALVSPAPYRLLGDLQIDSAPGA